MAAFVQKVSYVEKATEPLGEVSPKQAIEWRIGFKIEACSQYYDKIVPCRSHSFLNAFHRAFSDHRPLTLSPDMLWLLIAQGISQHVNANADACRKFFVAHEGKEELWIEMDDFIKGSLENPWEEAFDAISSHIKIHIGKDNHSQLVATFSTTGPREKAANEVVLMETLKEYFDYGGITRCGIPEVHLEGTADDWHHLVKQTETIGTKYELNWWTKQLLPTLRRIAANAGGHEDAGLWRDIYKWNGVSGGPYVNGWIVDFFPYLQSRSFERGAKPVRNVKIRQRHRHGVGVDNFPSGLSQVPFTWKYIDTKFQMEFIAGFIGFTQDPNSLAVRPKIGWAVRDCTKTTNEDQGSA